MSKRASISLGFLLVTWGLLSHRALAVQEPPAKLPQKSGLPIAAEQTPSASALNETESQLRKALAADPNSADLLYRLGLVLRQKVQPRASLEMYTRAAKIQKPTSEQLLSVALDYVLLNDYGDAVHWLQYALTSDPENIAVLYSLGRCLYTQNRFAEAEGAFLHVLSINAQHLKAEENLGLTYDAENKPDKAEAALRKAVQWADEQHLHDQWPYLDLGTFLLDQARAAEALPYLEKAASTGAESASCHETLARALLATGKTADGIKEFESAIKLDPKNPKTHFELGRAYRSAGNQEAAQQQFAISKSLYGEHNQD